MGSQLSSGFQAPGFCDLKLEALSLSRAQLFAEFSRPEYWSG